MPDQLYNLVAIIREALQMDDQRRNFVYGTDTLDRVLDAIVDTHYAVRYSPKQEVSDVR